MKKFKELLNRRKSQRSQSDQAQRPIQAGAASSPKGPIASPQSDATRTAQNGAHEQATLKAQATAGTLSIALRNTTTSSTVYAYITGQAIDNNNALFLLSSDGVTPYFPASPSEILQPLQANVAIALGAPGNTVTTQIPHIAGGRIWFSIGSPLTFRLNPGPALVEPSVTNPSDPNYNLNWAFAEFTFNSDQLYANISYVDFVSIPVALTLTTANSGTQNVLGLPPTGLQTIADGLRAQAASDGQGWDQLIINNPQTNTPLRILSPNNGMVLNPSLLTNYYDTYTAQVFERYTTQVLDVDTQAGFGIVSSLPSSTPSSTTSPSTTFSSPTTLVLGSASQPQSFTRPTTSDIFTCSTGPFATGADAERNTIIPRLAAAFNRSTLLATAAIPAPLALYYKDPITNHYSRIVHAANTDGRGYAFPYDDVQSSGSPDQSGEVNAGDAVLFTVTVGGGAAT